MQKALVAAATAAAAYAMLRGGGGKKPKKEGELAKKPAKAKREFSRDQCWAEVKKMINIYNNARGIKFVSSIGGCAVIFVLVDIMKAQMQG